MGSADKPCECAARKSEANRKIKVLWYLIMVLASTVFLAIQ